MTVLRTFIANMFRNHRSGEEQALIEQAGREAGEWAVDTYVDAFEQAAAERLEQRRLRYTGYGQEVQVIKSAPEPDSDPEPVLTTAVARRTKKK